jgi:hypothetical protein
MRNTIKKLQKGQSLVEFSLGMIVILLIMSGLLDLGRVYFTFVALEDGVGEAALYLSINPACIYEGGDYPVDADHPAVPECADPNNAEYRAQNAGSQEVDWSKTTLAFDRPADYGVGDPVHVYVQYSYPLLTPIIPKIVGINPITLSASASQIIVTE